jgi:hypothetical protein
MNNNSQYILPLTVLGGALTSYLVYTSLLTPKKDNGAVVVKNPKDGDEGKRVRKRHTIKLTEIKDDSIWGLGIPKNHLATFYEKLIAIPDEDDVNIIIKTHGGSVYWTDMIINVIEKRNGKVRAFIQHYAHSAGAMIALSCDEIYMSKICTMSAIDTQVSIKHLISVLPLRHIPNFLIDPQNFVKYLSEFAKYDHESLIKFLSKKHPPDVVNEIVAKMCDEAATHSVIFDRDAVMSMGIMVKDWDAKEVPDLGTDENPIEIPYLNDIDDPSDDPNDTSNDNSNETDGSTIETIQSDK